MKIVGATFLSAVLAAAGIFPLPCRSISQRDREHLTAHLRMTGFWLPDEVAHLSAAQMNYWPAPDRWTIAEVVQHLVIA